MDCYKFYTKLYGYTHNYPYVPVWFLTPFRRLIRNRATKRLPKYFSKHPAVINRPRREDVIVSLTSFPARIGYVYMTIESLLRQTVLSGKVILWLSKEQFPTEDTVPERLKKLQNEVFAIRYVDGDIRSHKKYYYCFKEFPQKTIITVDDDIVYPPKLVELLLTTSQVKPNCIITNVGSKLSYTDGILDGYNKWKRVEKPYDNEDVVQIGFGGVLYPPHSLFKDCLNIELARKLTPIADDLWLNAMARLEETRVVKSPHYSSFLPIVIPNNVELFAKNKGQNKNDEQLKMLREYYSNTSYGDPY